VPDTHLREEAQRGLSPVRLERHADEARVHLARARQLGRGGGDELAGVVKGALRRRRRLAALAHAHAQLEDSLAVRQRRRPSPLPASVGAPVAVAALAQPARGAKVTALGAAGPLAAVGPLRRLVGGAAAAARRLAHADGALDLRRLARAVDGRVAAAHAPSIWRRGGIAPARAARNGGEGGREERAEQQRRTRGREAGGNEAGRRGHACGAVCGSSTSALAGGAGLRWWWWSRGRPDSSAARCPSSGGAGHVRAAGCCLHC
jgi:hypothetical protein